VSLRKPRNDDRARTAQGGAACPRVLKARNAPPTSSATPALITLALYAYQGDRGDASVLGTNWNGGRERHTVPDGVTAADRSIFVTPEKLDRLLSGSFSTAWHLQAGIACDPRSRSFFKTEITSLDGKYSTPRTAKGTNAGTDRGNTAELSESARPPDARNRPKAAVRLLLGAISVG